MEDLLLSFFSFFFFFFPYGKHTLGSTCLPDWKLMYAKRTASVFESSLWCLPIRFGIAFETSFTRLDSQNAFFYSWRFAGCLGV